MPGPVTRSRKLREIAERQELILSVSRTLLNERGYLGLTMDRVAEATGYSKGTIYQHFKNKEEVVAALAQETASKRAELFERAATYRGRPRERMCAVGVAWELFTRLHPDHSQAEHVVQTASVREKIAADGIRGLEQFEGRCMAVAAGIVRDAVAQGDLALPAGISPQELTFGLWSLHVGAFRLLLEAQLPLEAHGVNDPGRALWLSTHRMLDGYGWQPLSTDHDYERVRQHARETTFSAEAALLENAQ